MTEETELRLSAWIKAIFVSVLMLASTVCVVGIVAAFLALVFALWRWALSFGP